MADLITTLRLGLRHSRIALRSKAWLDNRGTLLACCKWPRAMVRKGVKGLCGCLSVGSKEQETCAVLLPPRQLPGLAS